jgi:hypothetical protein
LIWFLARNDNFLLLVMWRFSLLAMFSQDKSEKEKNQWQNCSTVGSRSNLSPIFPIFTSWSLCWQTVLCRCSASQCANNQWLALLECLLVLGDWGSVKKLLHSGDLPAYFAFTYPPVATALCQLLRRMVEPLYKKYVT